MKKNTVSVGRVTELPQVWLNQTDAAKYIGVADTKTFRKYAIELALPYYQLSQKLILYKVSEIDKAIDRLKPSFFGK